MANVNLKAGQVYTMGVLGGAPLVIDSTDHVHDTRFCRNNMEITGTLKVTSNINTGGHIYGDGGTNIHDINYVYLDYLIGDGDTDTFIRFPGSNNMDFYTGNAHEMRLESDGDLHVDGDVIAYSSTVSDARLKTNIQPLAGSLDVIMQLEGVKFDWKYRDEKNQIGLIAQNVEQHIPEAVKEGTKVFYASSSIQIDEDGMPNTIVSEEQYKSINYDMIVPHLIEAVKTLKLEINELKLRLGDKL
mgnify:CR=1 FL=1|tara:strand:- start:4817 stop:5548 length:732 start_codon:yes stop_codon:yes gene_type:complete